MKDIEILELHEKAEREIKGRCLPIEVDPFVIRCLIKKLSDANEKIKYVEELLMRKVS